MAYNYLTEIDYSASGDTFYTGMVTSEANFLSIDNEIYDARGGESTLADRIQAVAAASTSGSGVLVSSDDTTLGYLLTKLVAGESIDFTENSGGGNETMTIDCEDATTSNKGVGETATDAEALAFAATGKFLVPSNLAALNATDGQKGVAKFSTDNFLVSSGNVTIKNSGVSLSAEVTGTLPIGNGGTGQTTKTPAFDALSPTTTKGDIIGSDGSDNIRLAVGTNTYALEASSGAALGIRWRDTDYFGPTTTKGDLEVSNGTKLLRLAIAANGKVLTADSGEATGTKWTASMPKNHITGLVLSTGSTADDDINISTGEAKDSTSAEDMTLGTALGKSLGPSSMQWTVGGTTGTPLGGLDGTESVAGTPDASTIYYLYLIKRSDTGVVDACFSENAPATGPSIDATPIPTAYDFYRCVGYVLTDSSADILVTRQIGDGRDVVIKQAIRLSVATGLASTSFANVDISGYVPVEMTQGVLLGGLHSAAGRYVTLSQDGTNQTSVFNVINTDNSIGALNELYNAAGTTPRHTELNGNNIKYKVQTGGDLTLFLIETLIQR